ncbi:hypothetical protein FNH05_25710 [Amycolatopsis rhizosphaerae]|uniref:Uncharacterized protein n=1 Tax=Amycolatopsis rhizosphaerae TaxID=2053003 RepID=A0A558BIR2_9PSEU|nr:hypothetical protein FNH05_25710 [Amycolatopsis rhizosphaerae]
MGKPVGDQWRTLRLLITVKAAPNPSATYGETVCVAGLRLDLEQPGWVRLYPINFRDLESDRSFSKYDVVTVRAKPARNDPRFESWRPDMASLRIERHLRPWKPRQPHIEPYVDGSMCDLLDAIRKDPPAKSLAAIRPAHIEDIDIEHHPGWTADDQVKIRQYVSQLDLLGAERNALEAPRLRGWYRYRCLSNSCRGHRQGILDWEFVALQRRLGKLDDASLIEALRAKFLGELCAPNRDVAFYVGNQAKRQHVFSVLGVYYPPH